jgi:eukaryotic-like serine/threonine-protein kinase
VLRVAWAVDGYEPLARLGAGPTGVVLCARETTTNAIVALKYLANDFYQSPDFAVRYRGEVSMLDLIEHPNVAHIYEFIERDGRAVVVTELVEGLSWAWPRRTAEASCTGASNPRIS